MHEESDAERIDEGLPLRITILIAFLVVLYVLAVDLFGFASLV